MYGFLVFNGKNQVYGTSHFSCNTQDRSLIAASSQAFGTIVHSVPDVSEDLFPLHFSWDGLEMDGFVLRHEKQDYFSQKSCW